VTALESEQYLDGPGLAAVTAWQYRPGDIMTVQDPAGRCFRARLLDKKGRVRPFEPLIRDPEPPYPRRLCPAVPDRERMIWIIQKAVELGVAEIQPVITARAHGDPGPGPRQDKSGTWQRVAQRAAIQCRRSCIPLVHVPVALDTLLLTRQPEELWLCADWAPDAHPPAHLAPEQLTRPVTLLVGPEGGWTNDEQQCLRTAQVWFADLGPRVLRTETAAITLLAWLAMTDISLYSQDELIENPSFWNP
jgi:16S rRNA (uracil1498-N3)-methyltransferase